MPHIFLAVLKVGTAAGCCTGALNLLSQLITKKLFWWKPPPSSPDGGDDKGSVDIDPAEVIESFAFGTLLGNLSPLFLCQSCGVGQRVVAFFWGELVWAPLQIACITGKSVELSNNLPRVFGYIVFSGLGGYLACHILVHSQVFTVVKGRHHAAPIEDMLKLVASSLSGFALVLFSVKLTEFQLHKRIAYPSFVVVGIQRTAIWSGQALALATGASLIIGPWFGGATTMPWMTSVLGGVVGHGFMYCQAINIEASIEGRDEPMGMDIEEQQKWEMILEVLPLCALPYGFVQNQRTVPFGVRVAFKIVAALSATMYVAYYQKTWEAHLAKEREEGALRQQHTGILRQIAPKPIVETLSRRSSHTPERVS